MKVFSLLVCFLTQTQVGSFSGRAGFLIRPGCVEKKKGKMSSDVSTPGPGHHFRARPLAKAHLVLKLKSDTVCTISTVFGKKF